ncbi:MAG: alcohol dehydrogenase catalytic domain-containing protein [Candidatus Thiodiazotropha sp. 6PLUC3]
MTSFNAFRIHFDNSQHSAGVEELLLAPPDKGEVLIRVQYSSINYKDALAGTGKGKILRHFPLTGGIDAAGEVAESNDRRFKEGDPVIVTGYELSATSDGGYAEYLRVPADWVIPLPEGLTLAQSMGLGTAGFTNMHFCNTSVLKRYLDGNRSHPLTTLWNAHSGVELWIVWAVKCSLASPARLNPGVTSPPLAWLVDMY